MNFTSPTDTRPIHDVPLEERRKRQAVFAKNRQTVLVKFFAMAPLHGLEEKKRDEAAIDAAHAQEANKRGLDFIAYRGKGDTGFCLFQKESIVSAGRLLDQLERFGLRYVGGHWQVREGKGAISTLQFSNQGEAVPLPDNIRRLLASSVFNNCTVWCNLKYADDGSQFRLDTFTMAKKLALGEFKIKPRELFINGNTYRLV